MLINELTAGEDRGPRPTAKTLCEKVSREAAQHIIDAGLLQIGDMIGYFKPADATHKKSEYAHSGMFTGKQNNDKVGRITCHTSSRFVGLTPPAIKDEWFLKDPNYAFTLLHIPRASESSNTLGASLAGWWRIVRGKQTEFYYILADGRAVRTAKAPKSTRLPASPGVDDSRGYWFETHGRITIVWREDGSLATFDPSAGKTTTRVAIDRVGAVASRLTGP